MPEKGPKDILASETSATRNLGKNRPRMCSRSQGANGIRLAPGTTRKQALEWNPHGKRKVRGSVKTWRRSVEEEFKEANIAGKKNNREESTSVAL